ncbi:putative cardiolipin-specific deacylase, mitochondrial [Podospora australis]|uniref:Cardiolipin-specific deacylase, mitochondrial n=1 Tax=Podospora australis TaxID=1536484 RepID=A0AAN6X3W8_9PEZI|nr:putative cardiolipin-specific deacylase, mitochondrial [Podospora australis]
MLKINTAAATYWLPKRLRFGPLLHRHTSTPPDSIANDAGSQTSDASSTSTATFVNMSPADASAPPPTSQPILFPSHRNSLPHQHQHQPPPSPHQPQQPSQPETTHRPQSKMAAAYRYFPLGYKEAAQQWWTSVSSRQAEHNVLSFIPYIREATAETTGAQMQELAKADPFGQRVWRSTMVQLSGKNRALNEFSIERVGEKEENALVMLHGYGAGLGFFYKNFEPLSRIPGWKLYALDMLGMGNSSRPAFKIQAKDPKGKITEAESWFIDALEEWRKVRKLDKFTLMGHSMGGYLAVSYALKYPGRLNKLILVSPVGVPEDPWAVNADMPDPESSTMENEFTQDQESIVHRKPSGDNKDYLDAKDKSSAAKDSKTATTPPKRPIPGWLVWLWDANVSPFSIVRLAGPLGPRFVSGWTARRFNHLPADEKEALHSYSYALFRQRGSGEYALPYLLAPGAYARSPVINRIQDVGRQMIKPETETEPAVKETGFPIVFMYGENDWMDVAGGYAAEEKLKARIVKALTQGTEEEKKNENGSAKVLVVRKAGHHLYVDNPNEFNDLVTKELEDTSAQGKRVRAAEA